MIQLSWFFSALLFFAFGLFIGSNHETAQPCPEPTPVVCEISPGGLEARFSHLESYWAEYDKRYHLTLTCDPEDCLSVDELLKLRRP